MLRNYLACFECKKMLISKTYLINVLREAVVDPVRNGVDLVTLDVDLEVGDPLPEVVQRDHGLSERLHLDGRVVAATDSKFIIR